MPATAKPAALSQGLSALKQPQFRAVAGGYFGHCWELYAFRRNVFVIPIHD
ncbi:hypothetical protein [Idiomarina piscisalsi]|uniref:hypothetical protein n=1 Tax=Idiomarina piscisalsi TaxID=1096243 RepID=UPI001300B0E2|nr:hypothetical protein [Idiomarina piscisalsi]